MSTKLITNKEYIEKAEKKYGKKYDYSKVNYINSRIKITIICKKHGEFVIKPLDHLRKECYKCAFGIPNTKEWIQKAIEIHGNKYNYSKVKYFNSKTKIIIKCNKHNNEFDIIPYNHLKQKAGGCVECKKSSKTQIKIPKLLGKKSSKTQIKIPKLLGKKRNRYTTKTYIEACKHIHGNKYNYSETEYINGDTKVTIICKEHGKFEQRGKSHLQGKGCIKCSGKYQYTTKEWVEKAIEVHGDKYDYSETEYINANTKVTIICKEHGKFEQTASSHLTGRECIKCSNNNSPSTKEWVEKAIEVHGDKYDYSETEYIRNKEKIIIICKEHGKFEQQPSEHLRGYGCIKCSGKYQYTTKEFITLAKDIHNNNNNKYDYSKVKYINCDKKVTIVCKEHGDFYITPNKVLSRNQGCPKCSTGFSKGQIEWLEYLMIGGKYIQHKLNDGEHRIKRDKYYYYADGYCKETNTIYEYHGDFWHGNPEIYDQDDINIMTNTSFGYLYDKTKRKKEICIEKGYNYTEMWESNWKKGIKSLIKLQNLYILKSI